MEEKRKWEEKGVCPLRMVADPFCHGGSRLTQPCIYEKCEWYIDYPHFEMDCAINQIAYALMALASFGPSGVREVS